MVWGTPGFTARLEGASGRNWELSFERRLAPRPGHAENPASSVWLVRDASSGGFYAAKRQNVTFAQVNALVDEAAAWRAASLKCKVLAELVDVFVVRDEPCSVTFLHEFCARGHVPKRQPSEPVILTLIADLAEAADVVFGATGVHHGNVSYGSVLVDQEGRVRLTGFGAQRSAKQTGVEPAPEEDVFEIGSFLYQVVFGRPMREESFPEPESPYSEGVMLLLQDIVEAKKSRMPPAEAAARARELGAEPRAPVIDTSTASPRAEGASSLDEQAAPDIDRAVEKLTSGVDAGGAYSAVLAALERSPASASRSLFRCLFDCPIASDPLCTLRCITMLHNVMLDGPDAVLESARQNDKFLDWVESTWTQEAIAAAAASDNPDAEPPHAASGCFSGGDLAFYTSLLRRKARFHMLAAGGLSGAWERTNATAADGRDVLVTRRRKVVGGMADLAEMASQIGVRFAQATDAETSLKHASLRAIVDECGRAYNAALGLAGETQSVKDAEKVVPSVKRLWEAGRTLLDSVKNIRAAGADDWAEQFEADGPPDIVQEAEFRLRGGGPAEVADDMPKSGWEETEKMIGDVDGAEENSKESKKEKKRKKTKEKEEAEAAAAAAEADEANGDAGATDDIVAEDGAMVIHGADDAAKAAVTTMFGDLLKLDGGDTSHLEDIPSAPRLAPGEISDGQALASAFGAPPPEETQMSFDDEDDDGGYDNFRARQEEARASAAENKTGAWAARAGYGGGALVVHHDVEIPSFKSRPAYDQSYDNENYSVDEEQESDDESMDEVVDTRPITLPAKFVVEPKKLRTGDKLGEGAFGVVYKGEYKRESVAIKKMNKKMLTSKNAMSEFSNEVLTMCALSHPAVLKCVAASLKSPNVLLVTEFMKRGTLFDVLYKHHIKLTWSMIRKMALQLAEGLAYMEEQNIVHRDIKASNILVDGSYNAKIGDFGLAGPPMPPNDAGVSGTYQYMAPELLSGAPHSAKSDVYAYGLVVWEMISGSPPFFGVDPMEAAQQVMDANARPPIPAHCLRPYADVIQKCWRAAPVGRPSFKEVVELIKTTTK